MATYNQATIYPLSIVTSSPDFNHWPAKLEPLFVPVPRNLAYLGYDGQSRLVACHWNQAVDELAYHDGNQRGVGESDRFLAYAGHANVEAELTMNFGLSDWPCSHWLLLDRANDMLFAGAPIEIRKLLLRQHNVDLDDLAEQRFEATDAVYEMLEDDPEIDALEDYLDRWSPGDVA